MAWYRLGAWRAQRQAARAAALEPQQPVQSASAAEPTASVTAALASPEPAPAPTPVRRSPSKRELGRPVADDFETPKKKGSPVDPLLEAARAGGAKQGTPGAGKYVYALDADELAAFIESGVLPPEHGRVQLAGESVLPGTQRAEFNLRDGVELERAGNADAFTSAGSLRAGRHMDLTYLGPAPRGEAVPVPVRATRAVSTRAAEAPRKLTVPRRNLSALGDERTRGIEAGRSNNRAAQKLPPELRKHAQAKLRQVLDATHVSELDTLPGNRFERLTSSAGVNLPAKLTTSGEPIFSIRVNDQYRVAFNFSDGKASNVFLLDYHKG